MTKSEIKRQIARVPAPPIDLCGRDPEDFKLSTQVQGQLRCFAAFLGESNPAMAVRGAFPVERLSMLAHIKLIRACLDELDDSICGGRAA